MEQTKQERLKISNEMLDNFLVGVKTQEDLWGKDGVINQLNKAILERILNAEMDFHLQDTPSGRVAGNSRNGHGKKKVSGTFGPIELETPRARQSTFEPQIVPKRSTKLGMIDNAILSLYAKGMTVRDIQATLQELYHVEVSHSLILKVTEAVNEGAKFWAQVLTELNNRGVKDVFVRTLLISWPLMRSRLAALSKLQPAGRAPIVKQSTLIF